MPCLHMKNKRRNQTHWSDSAGTIAVAVCAGRTVLVCLFGFVSCHILIFSMSSSLTQISEQTEVEPETVKVHNYSFIYF